jgi:hypothetical protein
MTVESPLSDDFVRIMTRINYPLGHLESAKSC